MKKLKQWFLNRQNAGMASRRFRKEFIKILEIEQKYPDRYNQKDYNSCYDRMSHMINDAIEPVKKIEAYAAACHRDGKHGDPRTDEIVSLSKDMTAKDVKLSRGWWVS